MKATVFGATDLSMAALETIAALDGIEIGACIGAPPTIEASFVPGGRPNTRHVDLCEWAEREAIPSLEYRNPDALLEFCRAHQSDIAVVAGWYHMIPTRVRSEFTHGAVALHGSLLPKFRGGAPLNWALLSGSEETGISLFELSDGVDEGPLYGQRRIGISSTTTISDLIEATTALGLELLRDCLPGIADGTLQPVPQVGAPSYCLHRSREDGRIDWNAEADSIDRLIRATTRPYPGAFTTLDGDEILIWAAELVADAPQIHSPPGGIVRIPGYDGILIVARNGCIMPTDASLSSGGDALAVLSRAAFRRLG